jgi:hypothetical protein
VTDIFFSYSSNDRERVAVAYKALTERGFDVFWDLEVPANTNWNQWIKAQLERSPCVIVFWTANSVLSDNVMHEVEIARKDGKLIQGLLDPLDTRDLPMGLLADQAARLMDWDGNASHAEWLKLIAAAEEKATPKWLRQKVVSLEVAVKGERQRLSEADAKVRALEEAYTHEVAAQGDLRRERDAFRDERDQFMKALRTDSMSAIVRYILTRTLERTVVWITFGTKEPWVEISNHFKEKYPRIKLFVGSGWTYGEGEPFERWFRVCHVTNKHIEFRLKMDGTDYKERIIVPFTAIKTLELKRG